MRFTEHELTEAVTSAAKTVAGARQRGIRRRRDREETWAALSRHERYLVLDAVGGQVLPVLLALPDVEVPTGTRPTFTDAQVSAAVAETIGDAGRGLRGKVAVAARVALVREALATLPRRQE
ncbi:hypothetical protein [Nocardioides sp.]|uniref:hypothetical protein n=1 Tax=Nocardioides sp. TaxID=35761 RepID=UPI00286D9736|nr:hypothetical protein [Nocardioides sp.]